MRKSERFLKCLTNSQTKEFEDIRTSTAFVLSKNKEFESVSKDADAISSIAVSVFKTLYSKYGNGYRKKKNAKGGDFVDNIIDKTGNLLDIEDTKNKIILADKEIKENESLDYIRASCVSSTLSESLDEESSKDLDNFESNYRDVVNDVVYSSSGFDLSKLPPRKDLLYIDCILAVEGTNKNRDTLTVEELEKNYKTLIGMPLVEEHMPQGIKGVFYAAELVRIKPGKSPGTVRIVESGGKLAVRAKAYVYKNRFPREAYVIKTRQDEGLLRFSFELGFEKAKCSFCSKEFSKLEPYCEHLMFRFEPGSEISRIPLGIFFVGGAYTIKPAEKAAVGLEVSDLSEESDKKDNGKVKSCVNIVEDELNKDNILITASEEDTDDLENIGGKRMFEFETVEDLMASETVQALIESKVNDLVKEEREVLEAASEEFEAQTAEKTQGLEEALTANQELKSELEAAESRIKDLLTQKRVSDVMADLLNNGYKFDSDEEISAFEERISDKSDEDVSFIVDLMKKSVAVASDTLDSGDNADPNKNNADDDAKLDDVSDVVKASQDADDNGSDDNSFISGARRSWDIRTEKLKSQ